MVVSCLFSESVMWHVRGNRDSYIASITEREFYSLLNEFVTKSYSSSMSVQSEMIKLPFKKFSNLKIRDRTYNVLIEW